MTWIADRPMSALERRAMAPVIQRMQHYEREARRAEDELLRLVWLARDFSGQRLNLETMGWERPTDEATEAAHDVG